jgi:hypothetical protein
VVVAGANRLNHNDHHLERCRCGVVENTFLLVITKMAGYSSTPLPKKLGIKEQSRITFVNAPEDFQTYLGALPEGAEIVKRLTKPLDIILLFVTTERALAKDFAKLAEKLATNGMLWVAWPKKSSGVATDLSFERVQRIGLDAGLVDVKICAIDETWSGLKFVFRLKDRQTRK